MCVCNFRIVSCPRAQVAAEIPPFLREPLWECKTARTGTPKDTHTFLGKKCKFQKRQSTEKTLTFLLLSHTRIRARFNPLDKITNKTRHLFSLFYIAHTHGLLLSSVSMLLAVTCHGAQTGMLLITRKAKL